MRPLSPSTKYAPTIPIPPSLPVRHNGNGNISSTNNKNEKPRKLPEKPPALPPKTAQVKAAANKLSSSPCVNTNRTINKENQPITPPPPAPPRPVSPSQELRPVERYKSKNQKRKMTEEEAIRELG